MTQDKFISGRFWVILGCSGNFCLQCGGTVEVEKLAIMLGYHMHVWYNKKAITNILSLSNWIKQYQVTYDSNDQMFVMHCDSEGKLDMEFE
jgi:hypothetical protein